MIGSSLCKKKKINILANALSEWRLDVKIHINGKEHRRPVICQYLIRQNCVGLTSSVNSAVCLPGF